MAVTFSYVGGAGDGSSLPPQDTIPDVALTAGRLYLLHCSANASSGAEQDPPTITHSGATWSLVAERAFPSGNGNRMKTCLFRCQPADDVSAADLTVAWTTSNGNQRAVSLIESSEDVLDDSANNGAGAIVQLATNSIGGGSQNYVGVILPNAISSPNNATVGVALAFQGTTPGFTPGEGFVELDDRNVGNIHRHASEYWSPAGDQGIDISTNTNVTAIGIIGVEVAGVDDTPTPVEIVVSDMAHSHGVDGVSLIQHHVLSVGDPDHGHGIDVVSLTQHHVLSVDDVAHAHGIEGVTLDQSVTLSVDDIEHAHGMDAVTLTQHHVLTVDDMSHAHTVDSVALAQNQALSVDDIEHAHGMDAVTLTQHHALTVDDMSHGHRIEAVTLKLDQQLAVDDARHAHTIESVALTQHHALSVDDMTHDHELDEPTLAVRFALSVDELEHVHGIDAVSLTPLNALTVDDLDHAHATDSVSLTQHHVLSVDDLFHTHTVTGGLEIFTPYTGPAFGPDASLQADPWTGSVSPSMWSAEVDNPMNRELSSLSLEYVSVRIGAYDNVVELNSQPVWLAFKAQGQAPDDDDWLPAEWSGPAATRRVARVLVGPGGAIELNLGTHFIWYRVDADPEVPVGVARGQLRVRE